MSQRVHYVKFVVKILRVLGKALCVLAVTKRSNDMTFVKLHNGGPEILCQIVKSRERITSCSFQTSIFIQIFHSLQKQVVTRVCDRCS